MSEYDSEPIRGLPGELPEDEHIIWQGSPEWKPLVLSAWHIRLTIVYFAIVVTFTTASSGIVSGLVVAAMGLATVALFALFQWGVERTTVYTLTNKRVVLRIGVALNACINLPLSMIESADLKMLGNGQGSIVFNMKGLPRIGYVMLWPHARSMRIVTPKPMMRAIPEAASVAQMLFEATSAVQQIAAQDASPKQAPGKTADAEAKMAQDIPLEGLPA